MKNNKEKGRKKELKKVLINSSWLSQKGRIRKDSQDISNFLNWIKLHDFLSLAIFFLTGFFLTLAVKCNLYSISIALLLKSKLTSRSRSIV